MYDIRILVYQLHVVILPVVPCTRPASSESVTGTLSRLSYHTQLMHTDLQVIVWEYSRATEYKFLGEVSNPIYILGTFLYGATYLHVSSRLYNLPR